MPTTTTAAALKRLDIEKIARAVEADAGQPLPELRQSLAEAQAGRNAQVHTPAQIMARRRGRPAIEQPKVPVTMRVDADVLAAIKATGTGWQTRVNELLREAVRRGKLAH